jgi:hypothetical protein
MKRIVAAAKEPGFAPAGWAPLAEFVETGDFERVGTFLEVMDWQQYTEMLTQWASATVFETTLRRITELPGLVYLEIEERHVRGGKLTVVNSLTVFEFSEAGKIRHLDVYLQQRRLPGRGPRTQVRALALRAEQAEELHGLGAQAAEPVRYARVELGRFARRERQVVFTQDKPQPPVQDIEPLVAFVDPGIGFCATAAGLDYKLVCLDAARPPGQRQHRHAMAGDRAQVDAGVPGRRRADELVERDPVRLGQGKQ